MAIRFIKLTPLLAAGLLAACSGAQTTGSAEAGNLPATHAPTTMGPPAGGPALTMGPHASEPTLPDGMVELVLKDKLDGNLSGYCFDILGGGQNIDPSQGLQAHTCYSYRGALGSDQAIDPALFSQGIIKLVGFDVCALAASNTAGTRLDLSTCDNRDTQRFAVSDSGTISPAAAPSMCLTAGQESVYGRGGTSPHQIRTLTLQSCTAENASHQEWYPRKGGD